MMLFDPLSEKIRPLRERHEVHITNFSDKERIFHWIVDSFHDNGLHSSKDLIEFLMKFDGGTIDDMLKTLDVFYQEHPLGICHQFLLSEQMDGVENNANWIDIDIGHKYTMISISEDISTQKTIRFWNNIYNVISRNRFLCECVLLGLFRYLQSRADPICKDSIDLCIALRNDVFITALSEPLIVDEDGILIEKRLEPLISLIEKSVIDPEGKYTVPDKQSVLIDNCNKYFFKIFAERKIDEDIVSSIITDLDSLNEKGVLFRFSAEDKLTLVFTDDIPLNARGSFVRYLSAILVMPDDTSSIIHEIGHAADFINGDLSRGSEFSEIYRTYCSLISSVSKDINDEDLSYLFQQTEVFARCYEIYVHDKIMLRSICMNTENSKICPRDKALYSMISAYFDKIIEKCNSVTDWIDC